MSIYKLRNSPGTHLSSGVWCLCMPTCAHAITCFSFVLQGKLGTRPPTNHAAKSLAFVEIALVSASGVQWMGLFLDLPAW